MIENAKILFQQLIQRVANIEIENQLLRQELNHQLAFNLQDFYTTISGNLPRVSAKQIETLIDCDLQPIEKFIKWSNRNTSLNLTFAQFTVHFLSKEDKLLAKMVTNRTQLGVLPKYVLNKTKQILNNYIKIIKYFSNLQISTEQFQILLHTVSDHDSLDQQKLKRLLFSAQKSQQQLQAQVNSFVQLFKLAEISTAKNFKLIFVICRNKSIDKIQKSVSPPLITQISSPKSKLNATTVSIRPEFYDCLQRNTTHKKIRQAHSIEKHLKRIGSQSYIVNNPVNDKQKELKTYNLLTKIKKILRLEKQIENIRQQLSICSDFYPILFFQSVSRQKQEYISPWQLRQYLQLFGYSVSIQNIYLIFKKYSTPNGKMNFTIFCTMFDVRRLELKQISKNRLIKNLRDIQINTKRLFFSFFLILCKNQAQINKIKKQIIYQFKQKQIAHLILKNNKRMSQSQFQRLWQYFFGSELDNDLLSLFWDLMKIDQSNEITKNNLICLIST